MRILDDIYPSLNDHLTVPEPSKLTVFKLVSELLPRNRIANQLFKSLSALQDLYWSTEDPQPYVSFIVPVPPPQDTWSPKEVEQTISPCKGTISRLELYNTLSWQRIILPNIEFLDFPALKVLKISGRIMFANALASTYPDGVLAASRDHFSKRLPRSLENLEACISSLKEDTVETNFHYRFVFIRTKVFWTSIPNRPEVTNGC
jgi:hypothetical protein